MSERIRIGELARRTGVSVRTLRYYEEVGLLTPAARSPTGYRLYGRREIARLQQVRSLVQLGFSLDRVRTFLERPEASPLEVVELHLARVDEQLELQRRLRERLEVLARRLRATEDVSVEDLIQTIEGMTMLETYYTPEQLAELEERCQELGPEAMEQAQNEWVELIAQVQSAMEDGVDAADESLRPLIRRWQEKVAEFTGGDPGIAASLAKLYAAEEKPSETFPGAPSPELRAYVAQAAKALGETS